MGRLVTYMEKKEYELLEIEAGLVHFRDKEGDTHSASEALMMRKALNSNPFPITEELNIHFWAKEMFEHPNEHGEIGAVKLTTSLNLDTPERYAIWYDEEGHHYICLPTNEFDEDDEEELFPVLLSDMEPYFS